MTEAMKYWVREADIDGFRCDVAGYVPLDFWENARAELDAHQAGLHARRIGPARRAPQAFDASYAWKWNNAMADIAAGKADVGALFGYYSETDSAWPARGDADDLYREPRPECMGRHRVRTLRQGAAQRDRAVVRRRRHCR